MHTSETEGPAFDCIFILQMTTEGVHLCHPVTRPPRGWEWFTTEVRLWEFTVEREYA